MLLSGPRCALQIPHVNRQEFTLLDITEDGFVSQPTPVLTAAACQPAACSAACALAALRSQLSSARGVQYRLTAHWQSIPAAHVLMLPELCWCCGAGAECTTAHLLRLGALLSPLLQVSLMDDQGNTKDDLGLPKGTDDAEKLAAQIKKDFDDGKELQVTVLKVGS